MHYEERQPPARLAGLVQCLWSLEAPAAATPLPADRILPDGTLEIVLHHGDRFMRHRDGSCDRQPRSFVVGGTTRAIDVSPSGRVGVIGARLLPEGAYRFLSCPLHELRDRTVPVEDLWGSDGRRIAEQIGEACSVEERFRHLDRFLEERLLRGRPRRPSIELAIRQLTHSHGRRSVGEVAATVGLGMRQIERGFRETIGLTPKEVARVARFQWALARLQDGSSPGLSGLAHEAGYSDQAHFTREFRTISGSPPSRFLREAHQLSDLFTDAPGPAIAR